MTADAYRPPAVDDLEEDLRWATRGPAHRYYKKPDHFGKCRHLASLVEHLQPEKWQADPNYALTTTLRRGLAQLPEGGPPPGENGGSLSWHEMGELLCGFKHHTLPRKANGQEPAYDEYLNEARRLAGHVKRGQTDGLKQHARNFRKHLAAALLQLTPDDFLVNQEQVAQAEASQTLFQVMPDVKPAEPKAVPKRRKRKLPLLISSVLVMLTAGMVLIPDAGDGADDGKGKTAAANLQSASPTATASSLTDLPTGDDLDINFGFPGFPTDLFDSYAAVFQEKDLGTLKELLSRSRIAAAPADPALMKAIGARGYFLSGMKMNLVLTSRKGNLADIVRILPVNITHDKIPVGAAFLLPSQGGGDDVRRMTFDMDSTSPVPRHPAGAEGPEGQLFFGSSRITIKGSDADGEAIAADFNTVKGAYTFQVAVEYRVKGKRYKQLVPDPDGSPEGTFRISADLCPLPGFKPRLKAADLQALGKLQYKNLRTVDAQNVEQGYSLIPADASEHVLGKPGC